MMVIVLPSYMHLVTYLLTNVCSIFGWGGFSKDLFFLPDVTGG